MRPRYVCLRAVAGLSFAHGAATAHAEQVSYAVEPESPSASLPTATRVDSKPSASPVRQARRVLAALQYTWRQAWTPNVRPASELALPHGLTDPDNDAGLFVNTGILIPRVVGQPTVLTAQLALEYEPWRGPVSPFLDISAGGNIVLGRGRNRREAPNVEWLWSSTAGAGCKLYLEQLLGLPLGVRALGQLFWSETARVPLAVVFSGFSIGAGIEYHWEVPELRLLRQLSHGEDMPEGW